jgi:hypothetical protein
MVVVSDPNLSWAVTKAALVVVSALASVVCLAWAGGRIAFPSESKDQWVEEKTTDSRPSSRARPRDANWPYGSEVAPRVLSLIRKVLVAEFYLANIASSLWKRLRSQCTAQHTVAVQVSKSSSGIMPQIGVSSLSPQKGSIHLLDVVNDVAISDALCD